MRGLPKRNQDKTNWNLNNRLRWVLLSSPKNSQDENRLKATTICGGDRRGSVKAPWILAGKPVTTQGLRSHHPQLALADLFTPASPTYHLASSDCSLHFKSNVSGLSAHTRSRTSTDQLLSPPGTKSQEKRFWSPDKQRMGDPCSSGLLCGARGGLEWNTVCYLQAEHSSRALQEQDLVYDQ